MTESAIFNQKQPAYPASQQSGWIGMVIISACGFLGLLLLSDPLNLTAIGFSGVVGMGAVGLWRWSWFLFQVIRSRLFVHAVFPRWREKATAIPTEDLPHMCFMVPTYKEKLWITERVFRAIAYEARSINQKVTVLVNSSSDQENAAIVDVLKSYDPDFEYINLIQMTQKDGKRKAMADGLRHLKTLDLPEDTIVALMDGDTELCPGTLLGCLPFFRMFPKVGALTTDEMPIVHGSYIFSEWFHLRFSQRHYQMCSMSLSRKVLCLTGRFSLFRCEAAFHPDFISRLESDSLDDWLWGRFKFLSGDDKSTWYFLLQNRYEMIYVPDVIVNSLETHSGSVMKRAYNNMRRWFGNMLRSSGRAIGLGPKVVGWFPWWCLLDQRISMWTSLITPALLLIALFWGKFLLAGMILCWVGFSRPLMLIIIFIGRPSHLKPIHFPVLVATQWSSSVIKVWNQMNMAKQSWNNRGNQSINANSSGFVSCLQVIVSRFLLVSQGLAFSIALLWWWLGILTPAQDIRSVMVNYQNAKPEITVEIVEAIAHDITPNDRKDDSRALQALIDGLPTDRPVQIELPIGELDLFEPVKIGRSDIQIRGEGAGRTILQAHFETAPSDAVLVVHSPAQSLRNIGLRGFTIRNHSPSPFNGILLSDIRDVAVKNINLVGEGYPAIGDRAENVRLESVTVRGVITPLFDLQKTAKNISDHPN
ncbi:MAG: glycosyltransferase [Limnospira sp.]